MKTLVLIRHATAENSHPGKTDFERLLSQSGLNESNIVASKLAEMKMLPEQIVSSPAIRAKTTAEIFAKKTNYPIRNIYYDKLLYEHFEPSDLLNLLETLFPDKNIVFVVGHNPLISEIASNLSREYIYFPPCKTIGLKFESTNWHISRGKIIFSLTAY